MSAGEDGSVVEGRKEMAREIDGERIQSAQLQHRCSSEQQRTHLVDPIVDVGCNIAAAASGI